MRRTKLYRPFITIAAAVSIILGSLDAMGQLDFALGSYQSNQAVKIESSSPRINILNSTPPTLLALQPSTNNMGDQFGFSVAIDMTTIVVGCPFDQDLGTNAGAVYIFEAVPDSINPWRQVKKITGDDTGSDDLFGLSVSISGNFLVVGAPLYDSSVINSGAAYLFARDQGGSGNWGQVQKLEAPSSNINDQFATVVSIDGETIVIGVPYDFDNSSILGSAHVFSRRPGQPPEWQHIRQITASDGAYGDLFGYAVAVSGDYIAIGSPLDDSPIANAGSAYIFSRNQGGANRWGQTRKVTASDAITFDQFGASVSLNGQTLVVGAPFNTVSNQSGSAYIFEANQGGVNNWGRVNKLWPNNGDSGDQFGSSIALRGDWMLVGAPFSEGNASQTGSTYLFNRTASGLNNWEQINQFYSPTGMPDDRFGAAVALNETTLVMGVPMSDEACPGNSSCESGSAYVVNGENPWMPPFLSIIKSEGSIIITITGTPEQISTIQASPNLNRGNEWLNLGSITNDLAGMSTLTLSNLSDFPLRFFRAMQP